MRLISFFLVLLGLMLPACGAPDTRPKADAHLPIAEDIKAEDVKTKTWNLRRSESRLEFISVKNGTIVEINRFTDLSGMVLPDGGATILIKLNSVETNIEIRDQRMKKYLFKTDKLVSITVKAQLGLTQFASMPIGTRKDIELRVGISMHGHNDVMDIALVVTRLGDNKVVVDSRTPIILDTDTFGFGDGIIKLQELANLDVIAPEVPIMFSLVFER